MLCEIPFANRNVAPGQFPNPELDCEAQGMQQAILAGGCFWCVEAVFRELKGVQEVVSGYAGGAEDTADYRSVCSGETGHAEVVRITFDASIISFGQILKVFFSVAHDPTQKNRQGNDVGTQYRSAVFYMDEHQQQVAAAYIRLLDEGDYFSKALATSLEPLEKFYDAEAYHQNYAALNPDQPYIRAVSSPKVDKLRATYSDKLKTK